MARPPQIATPGDLLAAWGALAEALAMATPACKGDARFVADALPATTQEDMRTLCASCPILAECGAFADASPGWSMAGFWAGSKRGTPARASAPRKKASDAA